jgi:hypothetical protein
MKILDSYIVPNELHCRIGSTDHKSKGISREKGE